MRHGAIKAGCKKGKEEAEKHEEVSPGPIRYHQVARIIHEEALCRISI
jgi:hypothetical protein